jgi:hypothetical protein
LAGIAGRDPRELADLHVEVLLDLHLHDQPASASKTTRELAQTGEEGSHGQTSMTPFLSVVT